MDGSLAPALQAGMQRFAKPWYRVRAMRVFRDNANLQANAALWSSIEEALGTSDWFVLLASPLAAASPWVNREVQWWRDHRCADRILVVLTEGEFGWPGDVEQAALPPALEGAFTEEPRWVDLRWLRNATQVDQSNPRLRESVADLVAAVRGVPKDTLIGEHIRQHRRAMRLARGGVATLVVLLVAALVASFVAFDQRNDAVAAQRRAEAAQARTLAAQRLVVARSLLAQADQLRATDPRSSLQLGIAAARLSPGPATSAGLTETLATNPYRGTLTGHTDFVEALAYSGDGRLVATGGLDGFVQLWATGRDRAAHRVGPTIKTQERVRTVAISPNGHVLAAGGDDDFVQLWNIADPTRPTRTGPRLRFADTVDSVAFSPDGHLMAVGGGGYFPGHDKRRNLLWNVDDPAHPRLVNAFATGPAGTVEHVAFSRVGHLLATGVGPTCALWNVADPAHPRLLGSVTTASEESTTPMAFSPDGRWLVTSDLVGGPARLWNTSDPSHIRAVGSPFGDSDTVGAFAFSPDSRTIASAGGGKVVTLWQVSGGQVSQRARLAGHTDQVDALAFSPDGSTLVSGSNDDTAMLWNVNGEGQPRQAGRIPARNDHGLGPVGLSANGGILAFGDGAGVDLWDISDPHRARRLGATPAQPFPVESVALSPNGSILVTVTNGDRPGAGVRIWDVSHPAHVQRLAGPLPIGDPDEPPPIVADVALSPDGRTLAVADDTSTLWSLSDPRHPRRLGSAFGDQSVVFAAGFSPDGRRLATGGYDDTIELWDVSDPAHVRPVAGPLASRAGPVYGVAFLAGGRTLSAVSIRSLTLWDVTEGRVPGRLGLPIDTPDDVPAAAVSPDGRIAGITGGGNTVNLYDVTDKSQPRPLPHLSSAREVSHMAFSADSRMLVTATSGGAVLWDLSPVTRLRADALAVACTRAGQLGRADWAVDVPGVPYENTCPTG